MGIFHCYVGLLEGRYHRKNGESTWTTDSRVSHCDPINNIEINNFKPLNLLEDFHMSHEKKTPTFHYTGCLIGINGL